MPETIEELVEYLISIGLATPDTIQPCSPPDVEEIRRVQGVNLPTQYEQFLRTMGRRAGDLLRGTDFFYPGVIRYFDEVREFIVENGITHLVRPDAVLVGMHQGAELYWLDQGDPSGPMHWYQEGAEAPKMSWPTLLDGLIWNAKDQVRLKEKYQVFDEATGQWIDRADT
jgi:hypothetical protein